jgi:hypothetical protein
VRAEGLPTIVEGFFYADEHEGLRSGWEGFGCVPSFAPSILSDRRIVASPFGIGILGEYGCLGGTVSRRLGEGAC